MLAELINEVYGLNGVVLLIAVGVGANPGVIHGVLAVAVGIDPEESNPLVVYVLECTVEDTFLDL